MTFRAFAPVTAPRDGSSVDPVNQFNTQPNDSTYGGKDAGLADDIFVTPASSATAASTAVSGVATNSPTTNGNKNTGGGAPPAGS